MKISPLRIYFCVCAVEFCVINSVSAGAQKSTHKIILQNISQIPFCAPLSHTRTHTRFKITFRGEAEREEISSLSHSFSSLGWCVCEYIFGVYPKAENKTFEK
jgi:hypothetical protein